MKTQSLDSKKLIQHMRFWAMTQSDCHVAMFMLFNCSDLRIPSEILLGKRRMPLAAWENAWRATEGMSRSMSSSSKPAIGMVRRESMGRRRGKEIRIYAELQMVLLYRLNNAGVSCCAEAAAAKASTSANSGSRFQKHFHIRRLNQTLVCNIYISD